MRFLDSICWLSDQDGLWVGRGHWGPTEHTVLSGAQAPPAGDKG